MDKRWLGIIIILILGIGCMYLVVDSSPTVGKAVTVCKEMTITLPSGFNILKSTDKSVHLLDHQNHTVNITIIKMGDESKSKYQSELKSLNSSDEIEIQGKVSNKTGHMILYKNLTNDKEYSMTYFVKDNRTVSLHMDRYTNWENDWNFIIDTIQHNFKQNK